MSDQVGNELQNAALLALSLSRGFVSEEAIAHKVDSYLISLDPAQRSKTNREELLGETRNLVWQLINPSQKDDL